MTQHHEPTETSALLAPPPTSADASPIARLDGESNEAGGPKLSTLRLAVATAALASLIFLQATGISLLSTIQTAIADDLQAYDSTTWFTSSYLIAMSSVGPLNGKLAIVFSPRICIVVSSIILGLGTLVAGLSNTFTTFVVGRGICGVGSAGIFTISIILVLDLSSPERRGLGIGILNTGYTIGVAGGAILAGALLPLIGWRWIFLMQTPLSMLAGVALFFSIPKDLGMSKQSTKSIGWQLARLDYFGAIALTASIVLLLYAASALEKIPVLPLALSLVTLTAFVLIELYWASDPIIPVSLLTSRGLLLSCLAQIGYMMARWSVLFYSPAYTIALRSWSPAVAGMMLIPTNTGFALGGILAGWLHIRRHASYYWPTLTAYIIFPLTLIWLSALTTGDSEIAWVILDVLICGLVTGAALNYNLAHVLYVTPKSTHYVASSLLATFRGFSASFGSAVGGGLFTRTLYQALTEGFAKEGLQKEKLVHQLLGAPALVQSLEGIDRKVAIAGYEAAFSTLFLAGAGLAATMILLQAGTGWRAAPEEDDLDREVDDRDSTVG
ncbi:hypothetical protein AMS68_002607 [Peltaster fructicola]|uniref:Major facilitator superfamily (MFS) profile domain-containing protein n=1 Tax=Peltaster fructicola TaxID=286661 RepID=A0A6H0XRJ4_9PEZI|nr:hypothetical protein AMS68_002607 [Peltaster fructicola]